MAKQWLSASDPYFAQFSGVDEFGQPQNQYQSTIAGLQSLENWQSVARQLGYQGPFEIQVVSTDAGEGGGGNVNAPAPEFLQFIQQKKAEGYDFVVKANEVDKRTSTFGLQTPTGEVVAQRKVTAAGFGEFLKEFVLPAIAAYGAVNFLGPRLEGLTNALSGGGQLTAADLASLPSNVMGQSGQVQGVVTPAAAATDAAAIEAAQFENALIPGSQTGVRYPYGGGESFVNPTAGTVGTVPASTVGAPVITADYTAAANQLASMGIPVTPENVNALLGVTVDAGAAAGGLSAEVLDAALAGGGAAAPTAATTAATAPVAATSTVAAPTAVGAGVAEGMVPGGLTSSGIPVTPTEALAATQVAANVTRPGLTGIPELDKAIEFLKTPAGSAVLSGIGSVAGGVMQANAAEAAANQQAEAARNALQLQREMFEYQKGLLEPYRTAGTAALKRLEGALGLGGAAQPQQMLEMDPGYGFRLGEGMKALERMQAARGNMLSGGALKAGQRYAQDYASGEYSNAYNRLANIAGLGQTVGGQLGSAAQQFGTSAGNVMGQEANALAAGRIGRGSAYSGAVQGGLNAYSNYLNQQQQNQLFRDIFGRTAIGG